MRNCAEVSFKTGGVIIYDLYFQQIR